MKLQLESQKDIKILNVTEDVSDKDIAILKAGMSKLLKSPEDNRFILNLLGAETLNPSLFEPLTDLRGFAATHQAQLLIASTIESISDAKSVDDAVQLLNEPASLENTALLLVGRVDQLKKQEGKLRGELEARKQSGMDLQSLRGQKTRYQEEIETKKRVITALLQARREPVQPTTRTQEFEDQIWDVLKPILTQQKLLESSNG